MPTLTPAINGSNAIDLAGNTYVTLDQSDTYFESRKDGADWISQDQPAKEAGLITAALLLDSHHWIGGLVQENQPMAWPRVAIRPIERRSRRRIRTGFETLTGATGGLYDLKSRFWASTAIPTPIKNAQCELAYAIQVQGWNLPGNAEIKSFSDDKMNVVYDRPLRRGQPPLLVQALLKPFLLSGPELERG